MEFGQIIVNTCSSNKLEPVNQWGDYRPGVVGSVGDVLPGVRLKQSAPDMEQRWERWNTMNPGKS